MLPLGSAWQLINMIDISGVLSCRPGYRCIAVLPEGNLQGCFIFRPRAGLPQMLAAVEGKIYAAPYPFTNFTQIAGLQFSPYAKQIYWEQATQSAQRTDPGNILSPVELIEPREVVFIQD